MQRRNLLTWILTVVGAVLVWLPIAAPLLFGAVRLMQSGRLQVDYLMPAELFPAVFVGGGLLLWAALRARRFAAFIGRMLLAAVFLLVASQALAVVTGIASGETEMRGLWSVVIVALLALYTAAVVGIGAGGLMLLSALSRPVEQPEKGA